MIGGNSTEPNGGEGISGAYPGDDGFAEPRTGQLELGDGEASLPWLEGDDEEEYYEGYSAARLIGVALLGLLVLAGIGGGIWWMTGRMDGDAPVADGSIVHAPESPYKERPEDPGGRLVPGTGDTSFAVAEGQTRQARLDESSSAATAAQDKIVKVAEAEKEKDTAVPAPSEPQGVGVQVGAYVTRSSAEAGWQTLSGQYEALSGLHHRIVEGQADIGTVYRLQAVPGDAAAARTLCRNLRAAGLNCQVKQ